MSPQSKEVIANDFHAYCSILTFPASKILSLKLTSVLSVTCYAAVLWPELWLQYQSVDCSRGCSGIRYKDRKINLSVAMAMITPHHQRSQWYWYGLQLTFHVITTITPKQTILNMVARQWHCHIISIQKFHIPTATVLTSNGAGITSVG